MSEYEYDAVVIGGGSAGLTASGIAANFGAKIMMIEADRLGGDCTWTGCVPSKTLLSAGKVAHHIRKAEKHGLISSKPRINSSGVMQYLRSVREEVYKEADDPEIYRNMGIEVVQGKTHFLDAHSVHLDLSDGTERKTTSRYFFICTGGRASVPPIDGLDQVPYWTNETFFEIDNLPEELIIIGGGNIGTEMAQAVRRLGSEVTVIESDDRILSNDNPELSEMLLAMLMEEGINYILDTKIKRVKATNGCIDVKAEIRGAEKSVVADGLMVATGRKPNVEGLNLDAAGITYSEKGVKVNNRCRTNVGHIYACGDVTGEYQFTHMSEHMAKVAVTNALIKYPMKIDRDHVPWCTYTDPELAHVGATEKQLKEENIRYEVYRFPYTKIDRAVTESEEKGLIKVYARKWNGRILGADVLGARAGELISEYAVAMKNGVNLRQLSDTIHPYPTYGLGARRAADQWYIKNQSEWSVKLIQKIFGYRGEIPNFSDPDRIV